MRIKPSHRIPTQHQRLSRDRSLMVSLICFGLAGMLAGVWWGAW